MERRVGVLENPITYGYEYDSFVISQLKEEYV